MFGHKIKPSYVYVNRPAWKVKINKTPRSLFSFTSAAQPFVAAGGVVTAATDYTNPYIIWIENVEKHPQVRDGYEVNIEKILSHEILHCVFAIIGEVNASIMMDKEYGHGKEIWE